MLGQRLLTSEKSFPPGFSTARSEVCRGVHSCEACTFRLFDLKVWQSRTKRLCSSGTCGTCGTCQYFGTCGTCQYFGTCHYFRTCQHFGTCHYFGVFCSIIFFSVMVYSSSVLVFLVPLYLKCQGILRVTECLVFWYFQCHVFFCFHGILSDMVFLVSLYF